MPFNNQIVHCFHRTHRKLFLLFVWTVIWTANNWIKLDDYTLQLMIHEIIYKFPLFHRIVHSNNSKFIRVARTMKWLFIFCICCGLLSIGVSLIKLWSFEGIPNPWLISAGQTTIPGQRKLQWPILHRESGQTKPCVSKRPIHGSHWARSEGYELRTWDGTKIWTILFIYSPTNHVKLNYIHFKAISFNFWPVVCII